jgi:hypothetical protein
MEKSKDGGPAFPGLHPSKDCRYSEEGMTLRDYFAAKALQGLLSDSNVKATRYEFATESYSLADAMLKARSES